MIKNNLKVEVCKITFVQRILLIVIYGFVVCSDVQAQDSTAIFTTEKFISPVDHTIKLAGSFGEIRTNHFHGGIDIKSRTGEEGDTIKASMSGFISRIKIQSGGYGKVLYITHPNGYTTVYAHLQNFVDTVQQYINQKQIESQSYEIDVYPGADKYKVRQGQAIGFMGNTGRSYGPHLHFEIRSSIEEIPQNPYLFGIGPDDNKAPSLYNIDIHGLDNMQHKIWSKTQRTSTVKKGNLNVVNTIEVPAWRAGIAIQAIDLMNGAKNKNGVYAIQMFVDDTLYYSHIMNEVGFDVTKYINSHIDYQQKKKAKRTLIKCYKALGNKLEFYPTLVNNGEIKLFKNKPRRVHIVLKDFYENTTEYSINLLRRDAKEGELQQFSFEKHLKFDSPATFKLGSCQFDFPAFSLDKDGYISYSENNSDGLLSFKINEEYDPLFNYPTVSLPLSGIPDSLLSKVILINEKDQSYGGQHRRDSLIVRFGVFGNYKISIDTIPPIIDVKSFLSKAKSKPFFRFEIRDNVEAKGFAKDIIYDVYIDGEWVIAPLKALDNTLIVPLHNIKSGNHHIKIRVEDHSHNVTIWERDFEN
ncbi:MAG: M23 family metallopeptidase [Saprospiraceae bacterium]